MGFFFIILGMLGKVCLWHFPNLSDEKGGEHLLFERILRFFIVLITAVVGATVFELAVPTANAYFSAPLWHTELGLFDLSLA